MATHGSTASSNQLEATQLHDYDDANYGNSIDHCTTSVVHPEFWLSRQTKPIKVFWRRQIVATVPHDACRDHFGTYILGPILK